MILMAGNDWWIIVVAIVFAIGLRMGLPALMFKRTGRMADKLCRELVANSFGRMRMAVESSYVKSPISVVQGILVMLPDRLNFFPVGKGEQVELPLASITGAKWPKSGLLSLGPVKRVEFITPERSYKFTVNSFIYPVFEAGIAKLNPGLSAPAGK